MNPARGGETFICPSPERAAEHRVRRAGTGQGLGPRLALSVMRRRAAAPAIALVLAGSVAVGGCAAATAGTAGTASGGHAATTAPPAAPAAPASTRTGAPVYYGPPGPDPACAAALTAEQTLRTRQGKDQADESALDQDFTNFASALSAAAQHEAHPATAKAMNALAGDYTDLVASQSGA